MGDRPKNANQRRLEQLRAVRNDALPNPSPDEEIAALKQRIAELEAEVDRLRQILQAIVPRPDRPATSNTKSSRSDA